MRTLRSHRLMKLKALLFLIAGLISITLLLVESPHLRTALLLAIAIWCFCRAYYFAFYVLERYIDPTFRYSGLLSLLKARNSKLTTDN